MSWAFSASSSCVVVSAPAVVAMVEWVRLGTAGTPEAAAALAVMGGTDAPPEAEAAAVPLARPCKYAAARSATVGAWCAMGMDGIADGRADDSAP